MTLPTNFQRTKPVAAAARSIDADGELSRFEQRHGITLSALHREILTSFAAPIVFDVRCAYRPMQPSPWDRKDGSQTLETLYGPGEGEDTLNRVNKRFEGRLPEKTIAIGASSGGNQICLSFAAGRVEHVYFWDHENEVVISGSESDFANMYLISETFDAFVEGLFPRDESLSDGKDSGVIASKSWLDF